MVGPWLPSRVLSLGAEKIKFTEHTATVLVSRGSDSAMMPEAGRAFVKMAGDSNARGYALSSEHSRPLQSKEHKAMFTAIDASQSM